LPAAAVDNFRVKHGSRPRIALVSAVDELCGIAAYCRSLEKQLNDFFEVKVFGLDQYLLRGRHRRMRQLGDRHIKEICLEIRGFDAVNLQLEHGTLGRAVRDIRRRLGWIIAAAPQISVTLHTVLPRQEFDFAACWRALRRFDFATVLRLHSQYVRDNLLSAVAPRCLRRAQRRKRTVAIVHNRRDMRLLKEIHGIREVYDHPLAFLGEAEVREIRGAARRERFPLLRDLPDDAKLIGVFGFFGRYKGFETVIRAMQHLPASCHMLIFGSVHPNEIARNRPIDPQIASLLDTAYVDTTIIERSKAGPGEDSLSLSLSIDQSLRDILVRHPKDLSGRMHFMGALAEHDFLSGMAICDAVVMPYLEVGQSSSGPIAQALELDCRVIASRTRTFLQLAVYHPERIEFFDIGNHLELAERIMAAPQFAARHQLLGFNVETNKAVYLAANRRDRTVSPPALRREATTSEAAKG
jgi:glycosyltransferase involved in cell wall biosynthesis